MTRASASVSIATGGGRSLSLAGRATANRVARWAPLAARLTSCLPRSSLVTAAAGRFPRLAPCRARSRPAAQGRRALRPSAGSPTDRDGSGWIGAAGRRLPALLSYAVREERWRQGKPRLRQGAPSTSCVPGVRRRPRPSRSRVGGRACGERARPRRNAPRSSAGGRARR